MAKKSSIEKNKHRRALVAKYATKRAELKAITQNRDAAPEERFEATLQLAALPRNGARNRVRNRCALTGRSRGYYRKFGLSRLMLRDLASDGKIPGVVKSSW